MFHSLFHVWKPGLFIAQQNMAVLLQFPSGSVILWKYKTCSVHICSLPHLSLGFKLAEHEILCFRSKSATSIYHASRLGARAFQSVIWEIPRSLQKSRYLSITVNKIEITNVSYIGVFICMDGYQINKTIIYFSDTVPCDNYISKIPSRSLCRFYFPQKINKKSSWHSTKNCFIKESVQWNAAKEAFPGWDGEDSESNSKAEVKVLRKWKSGSESGQAALIVLF